MKSKLAATFIALSLVLTGCGASESPVETTSSATMPAETTLTQWVNDSGLIGNITGITDGLNTDLANLTSTDIDAANSAFSERAKALKPLINAVKSQTSTDDAEFERLRTTMATTLQDFADAAAKLGAATQANRAGLVLATTTSMTSLTGAIQALVDYIAAHGTDKVHPA